HLGQVAARKGWTMFISTPDQPFCVTMREEEREMHAYLKLNKIGIGTSPWEVITTGGLMR
ncbi:uncharacterized protein EV420DRAFT_1220811, partial [Desarmillaria tabescens]